MCCASAKIESDYASKLRNWDGDIDSLSSTVDYLQPVMDLSKAVTKDMINELQALKEVSLRSSWSQIAGFVQVNLMLNNYSKKQLKGAKLSLEYGADFLKLVKTEPKLKYSVTEVDIKKVGANDEMAVTLYFEPLKSTQASLNVHLDYDSKGGQSSGVSSAVFERVNLYKEGTNLELGNLDNTARAVIVSEPVDLAPVEVVEATVVDVEVAADAGQSAGGSTRSSRLGERSGLKRRVVLRRRTRERYRVPLHGFAHWSGGDWEGMRCWGRGTAKSFRVENTDD